MKFSIKKKLSAILLLSSFLGNVNDNSLVNALDDNDYKIVDLKSEKCLKGDDDTPDRYNILDLDDINDDLEEALTKYQSDLFSRNLKTTGIAVSKLLVYSALTLYLGRYIGSYVPEMHFESEEKQAVIKDRVGEKQELEEAKKLYKNDKTLTWSEIKKNYQKALNKTIDNNCKLENELAFALRHQGQEGFLYQIKSPWAPLGLQGPIFARDGVNVEKKDPYTLPDDTEELQDISKDVKEYFQSSLNEFYESLKRVRSEGTTLTTLSALEHLLDDLACGNSTKDPNALDSTLNLVEKLLPVLHLFYSINDSSKKEKALNWGLGFSPRVPVIRKEKENEKEHKILTTSDYYRPGSKAGDRKGTIEVDLDEKKVHGKLGMNLYGLADWGAKNAMARGWALESYKEIFGILKNIISSVRKFLEENKGLISELFQTWNSKVLDEIDKGENYITNLFNLNTGLKETLLGMLNKDEFKLKIDQAEQTEKTKKNELDEKEKERIKNDVINNMKIKRIDKKFLTEAIKKQLPNLPVFREIGEFFIDKFFDEYGFEYEKKAEAKKV